MLSNTDFADLLKSGASNGLTTDGKGRFGLEQVKTWDKQNNAQGKKKPSSFGKRLLEVGMMMNQQLLSPTNTETELLKEEKMW